MSGHPNSSIPALPEVDQHGGDELPTYEDLAAQHGPNSRFGRWRSWIEKRAAERYADLTPEEVQRRKQKGWGESSQDQTRQTEYPGGSSARPSHPQLHIQTNLAEPPTPPVPPAGVFEPLPLIGEVVSPSHLTLHQFGSRFLPHTTAPIRCLLPVLGNTLLLVGHDEGLSVLNMFPKEWTDDGLVEKGPNDAEIHHIWTGEGVYQMSLLEFDSTGDGTPQGVVLVLVGPPNDSPKEYVGIRTLRMYNLASLVNLAKWAGTQQPGTAPLQMNDLPSSKSLHGRHYHQKHKSEIPKSFLQNGKFDPSTPQTVFGKELQPSSTFSGSTTKQYSFDSNQQWFSPGSAETLDSSWDVIEDLPIRWATDYVSLGAQGTRLYGTSVLCYDLWRDQNERNRGMAYLAVVVKNNILLYHAPKGERAFRFIKEFYTPLVARNVTFVHQAVQDMSRSPSDVTPRPRGNHTRHAKGLSMNIGSHFYPSQLSLFVIFEKKASFIRIIDAAVGEVELYDEGFGSFLSAPGNSATLGRRSRASWDGGRSFVKEPKASWIPPHKVNLPSTKGRIPLSQSMYILTRGKQSQVLPYPLPANLPNVPPYRTLLWSCAPSHVNTRVCHPPNDLPPFLQFIALSDEGVEVQEVPLSALSQEKGKGRAEESVRAQTDVGGLGCGFLISGGLWHMPYYDLGVTPHEDYEPTDSDSDLSSDEFVDCIRAQEGMYGWVRKGNEDWRVFWLGGSGAEGQHND